jgi:hypothetical protein
VSHWRKTHHYLGMYTFDWCDDEKCTDPLHYVDEAERGYDDAAERSRQRAEVEALKRMSPGRK